MKQESGWVRGLLWFGRNRHILLALSGAAVLYQAKFWWREARAEAPAPPRSVRVVDMAPLPSGRAYRGPDGYAYRRPSPAWRPAPPLNAPAAPLPYSAPPATPDVVISSATQTPAAIPAPAPDPARTFPAPEAPRYTAAPPPAPAMPPAAPAPASAPADGRSIPDLIAARAEPNSVARLLNAGADANVRMPDGRSALDAALATGQKEVALLLMVRGARPDSGATPRNVAGDLR